MRRPQRHAVHGLPKLQHLATQSVQRCGVGRLGARAELAVGARDEVIHTLQTFGQRRIVSHQTAGAGFAQQLDAADKNVVAQLQLIVQVAGGRLGVCRPGVAQPQIFVFGLVDAQHDIVAA